MHSELNKYLYELGMSDENVMLSEEIRAFNLEMRQGLLNEESSLKMIPTYISVDDKQFDGKKAIVIDAGGTNLRIALVEFDAQNNATIVYLKKYPMIGLEEKVTAEQFFQILVTYLEPIIYETNKIGFCFSFPTKITEERDGIVLGLNKGIQISGIEGRSLGEELTSELIRQGLGKHFDITIINDTVACLLGGTTIDPLRQYDSFVGFILGTGTNTAYIEADKNNMIINVESGGYGNIKQGICDEQLDQLTVNSGEQKFEKMISGAYLGPLCFEIIKKVASDQQFFSEKFRSNIHSLTALTTEDISHFTEYPYSTYNKIGKLLITFGNEADREIVYEIIDCLLKRCAKLIAVNIFGILNRIEKGNTKHLPVCISTEGSTFFKFELLNKRINQQIQQLTEALGYGFCRFVEAKDSTIFGTAVAVLSN